MRIRRINLREDQEGFQILATGGVANENFRFLRNATPDVAIIGDNGDNEFRETRERAQRTGWQRSSKSLEKGKRVPLGGGPPQPPALLSRFGGV